MEGEDLATGRFILLCDTRGSQAWSGRFRIVTYLRAGLKLATGAQAPFGLALWSLLEEVLGRHDARHHSTGGTATRIKSESFGSLEDRADTLDLELRASWTPQGATVRHHLQAWSELLCTIADLPPLPEAVIQLPHRRS